MANSRTIMVIGATGKQGRAFINAVLQSEDESVKDIRIVALARHASSAAATSLVHLDADRVRIVEADLDKPDTVRGAFEETAKSNGGIWGVFLVLAYPGLGADATGEEKQGKLCADLCLEFKVHHLVFSSAERGGETDDDTTTLDRRAKVQIERHIRSLQGIRWTFLRPGFFMENFDGTVGSIANTVLSCGLKKDTKIQLIAADDIGHVALGVFQNSDQHQSKAIAVIGDALTMKEINDNHIAGAGKPLPSVPNLVGKALLAMNKHTKHLIVDLETQHSNRESRQERPEDHIRQCREIYPGMQTLEMWAKNRGRKDDRKANWNNVTVGDLIKGKR